MSKTVPTFFSLQTRLDWLRIVDFSPQIDREQTWMELKAKDEDRYWKMTKNRVLECLKDLEPLAYQSSPLLELIAERLAIPDEDVRFVCKFGILFSVAD